MSISEDKRIKSHKIRTAIAHFCKRDRNLDEIKKRFNLSGISAGAYLAWLCFNHICVLTGKGKHKTYRRVKWARVKPRFK